jgi:hypothetical protein
MARMNLGSAYGAHGIKSRLWRAWGHIRPIISNQTRSVICQMAEIARKQAFDRLHEGSNQAAKKQRRE